jgi:cellulose synthase/poly-beta-1,6-N-acetylglucosamine synthase-like glycosyltransferase
MLPTLASRTAVPATLLPAPPRRRRGRLLRNAAALIVAAAAVAATAGLVLVLLDIAEWLAPAEAADMPGPAWAWRAGRALFVGYLALGILPFLLCLGWRLLPTRRVPRQPYFPLVSVIVPAFNEEEGIAESLRGLAAQDYPLMEVLVVDDGSADLTAALVEAAPVRLVMMPANGGKAAALNAGLAEARGDIVVCSDGDSRLDGQAVSRLAARFADPEVAAVAGRIVLGDTRGLLRCWQALEYIFGQTIVKQAQVGAGGSALLGPGPVTAFRRRALLEIGGFSDRTLAEDFDATLAVLAAGGRVAYEPAAVAYTDSPSSWRGLARQRLRWSRGHLQVFRAWRHRMLTPGAGWAFNWWLPYHALVGLGIPLVEPALLLAVAALFVAEPAMAAPALRTALAAALLLEGLCFVQLACALAIAGERRPALWGAALISRPYQLVLAWTRLRAVVRELRNSEHAW